MVLIRVSQISSENEVCGVKWWHFYNKVVDKLGIVNRYRAYIWTVDHSCQNQASVIFVGS